jgi:transposase
MKSCPQTGVADSGLRLVCPKTILNAPTLKVSLVLSVKRCYIGGAFRLLVLGGFGVTPGSVPVGAFALRADSRLNVRIARRPFVVAPFTGMDGDSLGSGCHTRHYIPEKNIPSSAISLDTAIYLIVIYSPLEVNSMDEREQRGLEIAARNRLQRSGDGRWLVPSAGRTKASSGKYYTVKSDLEHCSCPDHELRNVKCKHIFAVEFTIKREYTDDGQTQTYTETVTVKKTYAQDWPAYNAAQTNEKEHFQRLLSELVKGVGEPSQKPTGRPRLPLQDMIFAAAFKVYSTVSGRRFISDLRDAHAKGYISRLPHYNSIFNYFENEALTPYLKMLIEESALPLQALESAFAVDSSGFSTCRFVQWVQAKYSKPHLIDKRDWVKVHLMCGVKTNIVTSVEITDRYANDSPQFKGLVDTTARNFTMAEVSADKAYLSDANLQAVAAHDAVPFIPFKSNSSPGGRTKTTIWKKMYYYFCYHQDEFLASYHKRSNVESTFAMIKAKFGDSLRSKTTTAQINEALCKVLCHNLCCLIQSMFELGVKPEFWTEELAAV